MDRNAAELQQRFTALEEEIKDLSAQNEVLKRQLQASRASKIEAERLRQAMECAEEGIWEWDLVKDRLKFDAKALGMLGYEPDEAERPLGWWFDQMHDDDRPEVERSFNEYLTAASPTYHAEFRLRRKDGSFAWVASNAKVIERDEQGKPILVIGLHRDISERKALEAERQLLQRRLSQANESSAIGMALTDLEGRFLEANAAACACLGYAREELTSLSFKDVTHPKDLPASLEKFREFIRTGGEPYSLEKRYVRKDGRVIWGLLSINAVPGPDGAPHYAAAQLQDITARKEALEALRESENRNRRLIETLPDIVYIYSTKRGALYWSPRMKDILGYDDNDRRRDPFLWYNSIHEEDRRRIDKLFDQKTMPEPKEVEYRVRDSRGGWRWFKDRPISATIEGDDLIVEGTATDITERKYAELELSRSESQLRRAQQVAKVGSWEFDFNTGVVYASEEARRIYGLETREWTIEEVQKIPLPKYREQLDQALIGLIQQGKPYDLEFEIERRGDQQHACVRSVAEYDPSRKVVTGAIQDISARKKAETELRKSEQKYRELMELAREGIWVIDAEARTTHVNASMAQMLGYDVAEMVGKPLLDFMSQEARVDCLRKLDERQHGVSEQHDFEFLRKDGSTLYATMATAPILDDHGTYRGAIAGVMDITERREMELELQDRAELSRLVADISQNLVHSELHELSVGIDSALEAIGRHAEADRAYVFRFRADGVIADNTHEWCADGIEPQMGNLQGVNFDEELPWMLPRLQAGELVYIADVAKMPEEAAAEREHLLAQDIKSLIVAPMFYRHNLIGLIGFDSVRRHFTWSKEERSLLTQVGITLSRALEHALAEAALRESQRSMSTLMGNLPGMAYRCKLDREWTMEYISSACEQYTGYTAKEIIEAKVITFANLIHADDRNAVWKTIKERVDKLQSFEIEYRIIDRSGNLRWFWERGAAVLAFGVPVAVEGFISDITERKNSEDALRQSEAKYRSYVDNAPDGIFIADREGRYLDANDAACRLTGYSREELLSMSVSDLVSGSDRQAGLGHFDTARNIGAAKGEARVVRKNGTKFWCSIDAARISDDRFIAFCSDVTETRRLREMEARAQRLETAGRVAGQVAHDFNNMLGPLMAYPGLIREELPLNSDLHEYLSAMEEAAQRMTEINQQLLSLGRRAHYNTEPVNLNDIVQSVLRETDQNHGAVVFDAQLDSSLMLVKGGNAQLHRVVSNLVQNALDAMKNIGTLGVRTENFYVDDVSVAYGRVPKGEYVKLTVSDTGCGIKVDSLDNIFDPFYTSKAADKKRGSGLGLSVVDAVVKDHYGYIDLRSRVGEGTSFYVYLPVTRETVSTVDENISPSRGSETILVIDDDAVQRDVASRLLQHLGYKVLTASSGEEGFEIISRKQVDLLVLDMIMPHGWDGAETYRRIADICPDQKAIIVSGYSETEKIREAQHLGAGAFVSKPLTLADLAGAVRQELDLVRTETGQAD